MEMIHYVGMDVHKEKIDLVVYRGNEQEVFLERRKGQPAEIIAYADRAMRRLQKKFFRMVMRGKSKQSAVVAVARELAGFVWGMMVGQIA